jgi:hypothetical protein
MWSFRDRRRVAGDNDTRRGSRLAALALIVATSALPSGARASQDLGPIADTRYTLSVNDRRTACGAYADFANGMRLALLKLAQDDTWVFTLINSAWNLSEGARYEMSAVVDGKSFGTAHVEALQPTQVAVVITPSFLRAFTSGQTLVIYGPFRNVIGRFSLKGTGKAVSAVGACNTYLAQRSTTQDSLGDPVQSSPPKVRRFEGPEKDA